jgi:hypothetical protein
MADSPDGFLSRWSRRKVQAREEAREGVVPEPAMPRAAPVQAPAAMAPQPVAPASPTPTPNPPPTQLPAEAKSTAAAPPPSPPPPTLDDVSRLTRESDYSRFVGQDVDPGVKNAALRKLFTDPHFNVMDGLDIYIDDYNTPDPLPAGMLEKMVQSEALGLFSKTPETPDDPTPTEPLAAAQADTPRHPQEALAHEDPDLRLQPHDALGPARPAGPDGHGAAGPDQDPGRER